jgi:uncharacterized protein YraI
MSRPLPRLLRTGLAALGAATLAVLLFTGPAAAAVTGTVHTSGAALNVRSGPHTSSSVVTTVANGASVSIDCQITGDSVTGTYGTSTIWDHLPAQGGYVSDAYIYTGSDGFVASQCGGSAYTCSTSGLGDPNSCATAVSWANSHISTSYNSDYYERCDHVVGLAYGFSASGSYTAYDHWLAVPSSYKHPGDTTVPAGGLAFFSGGSSGAGHVMISVGGGKFASNDIGGNGTYTYTTIATIESKWGESYVGWTQPWFQANH